MNDLALLGLRVASDEADVAEKRLTDLTTAAGRAETAEDRLAQSARRAESASSQMNAAILQQTRTMAVVRSQMGLTAGEGLNLSRQFADIGVTAAMGMNPLMIALQQGPQLLDIFQMAAVRTGSTVTGVMRGVGAATAAAVAPFAAIGGGAIALTGAVVGLGAAWLAGERSALTYERAVSGLGRSAGLTATELETLTEASAAQGAISLKAAQQQAQAYLSTGRVGREVLGDLISIGKDYASFMGVDAPDATKQLAEAMRDPDKAAREMTRSFGLLTQAQIAQIDAAMKAGDQARAQRILLDQLRPVIEGHAQDVAGITSAWDAVSRAIGNAITRLGEWAYMTDAERLADMDKRLQPGWRGVDWEIGLGSAASRRENLQAQRDALAAQMEQRERRRAGLGDAAAANQQAQLIADQVNPGRRSVAPVSEAQRAYDRLIEQSRTMIETMGREREEMGLTESQLVRLSAARQARELAATGTAQGVELARGVLDEAERLIEAMADFNLTKPGTLRLTPLDVRAPEVTSHLEILIERLRDVDRQAVQTAGAMGSAFGSAGQSVGGLLASMTDLGVRLAEVDLAEQSYRKAVGEGGAEQSRIAQFARDRAMAEAQSYGDMAAAAKGFFKEGSDGYRVLQAAEQAYRLMQFAMSVQAMIMGTRETAATVAQSAIRGTALAAEGAANIFARLGPWGFPVVGAMVGVLAAMGLRTSGGRSGGGGTYNPAPINDGSTDRARIANTRADAQAQGSRAPIHFDLRGAVVTSDLLQQMEGMAAQSAEVSVDVSRTASRADRRRDDRFKLGGRTT